MTKRLKTLAVFVLALMFPVCGLTQIGEWLSGIIRNGEFNKLTPEERRRALAELRANKEEFADDPISLQRYLFRLGDQNAFTEVVATFRRESVLPQGSVISYELLADSPTLDVVPAIADLLWRPVGGGQHGDVSLVSADLLAAWAIRLRIARSSELPSEVVAWAKKLPRYGDTDMVIVFRDWWERNRQAFQERRYQDVVPGEILARSEGPTENSESGNVTQAPETPPLVPEHQNSNAKANRGENNLNWPLISIVVAVTLILLCGAWLSRRR